MDKNQKQQLKKKKQEIKENLENLKESYKLGIKYYENVEDKIE